MKRPIVRALAHARPSSIRCPAQRPTRSIVDCPPSRLGPGFTLIEVLVATVLSLIIMAAVVTVFASITTSISQSRSTLEMTDRLRTTASQLKRDLEGVTATMLPPRRPETNEGYFEYIEGPVGPVFMPETARAWSGSLPTYTSSTQPYAFDIDRSPTTTSTPIADTTIGDNDDILMFTTHAKDRPFVGRCGSTTATVESWVAEVAWFVRGRTLYRRVLLVAPNAFTTLAATTNYYLNYDVSAHVNASGQIVPNSLGDLTKREYRFAHPYTSGFPYDARLWGQFGLPTLRETANANTVANGVANTMVPGSSKFSATTPLFMARDFSTNPYPWTTVDPTTGTQTAYFTPASDTRLTDDVVMTNVVGFDVKAWDPGAPICRAATSGTGANIVVMPGDPYYATALNSISSSNPPLYYGAYVDLGWDANNTSTTPSTSSYAYKRPQGAPMPYFDHWGQGYVVGSNSTTFSNSNRNTYLGRSGLTGNNNASTATTAYASARVYDTYSLHYEYDGFNQFSSTAAYADIGTNGADDYDAISTNTAMNGADDPGEAETCPPYPVPLRGIQIKIRSMDPDSGQVRELTVVQEFLPQ